MQKTWQAQMATATTTHSGGKDDNHEEKDDFIDNTYDDGQESG